MEQKNGNGQKGNGQKGLITFCLSYGKVLTAITALIIIGGFVIGFISWATRMSDNSVKIPEMQAQVSIIEKTIIRIETKQEVFDEAQTEMSRDIKELLKKK